MKTTSTTHRVSVPLPVHQDPRARKWRNWVLGFTVTGCVLAVLAAWSLDSANARWRANEACLRDAAAADQPMTDAFFQSMAASAGWAQHYAACAR